MRYNLLEWGVTSIVQWKRLVAGLAIGSDQKKSLKQMGAKWRRERVGRMGIICSIYYGKQ